jgi:predicted metalloprotease with PDZ domain
MKRTMVKLMLAALALATAFTGQAMGQAEKAAAKKAQKGYLGVSIAALSSEDKSDFKADFGVLITHVEKGQAADKAGIKRDDVIQYVNGEKVRRPDALADAIADLPANSQAKIKLLRDGKALELAVTLGARNDDEDELTVLSGHDRDFTVVPGLKTPPAPRMFPRRGAWLGVQMHELDADLAGYFNTKAKGGALILVVEKDSPAQKADLKPGDVIVKIGNAAIASPADAGDAIRAHKAGESVAITILRHGKEKSLTIELADQPSVHFFQFGQGDFAPLNGIMDRVMPRVHAYVSSGDGCCTLNLDEMLGHGKDAIAKARVEIEKAVSAAKKQAKTVHIRVLGNLADEI